MDPLSLLSRLADGEAHSGEVLAHEFGVTRTAIWKQIDKLKGWGLSVNAIAGTGYRLERPIDLIDATALVAALVPAAGVEFGQVEVYATLPSTNRFLLERPAPRVGCLDVCIAEHQSAGRGRRGRGWNAPFGGGLCVSASWTFADQPSDLASLSLAVGAAVRRVLCRLTGIDMQLKWPNDLVWQARKLGGILVEMTAEAQGGCHLVVGVGINVDIADARLATLSDWPAGAVDLRTATDGRVPSRTVLAARIVEALAALARDYAQHGFEPYREEWRSADYLLGKPLRLDAAAGVVSGLARGIDADGALILELASGQRQRIISGDVSVRTLPP